MGALKIYTGYKNFKNYGLAKSKEGDIVHLKCLNAKVAFDELKK